MCDVDDLKKINMVYGHDIGDKVLIIISKILKSNIRQDDYICRYGGDEFLLVFPFCPLDVVVNRIKKYNLI